MHTTLAARIAPALTLICGVAAITTLAGAAAADSGAPRSTWVPNFHISAYTFENYTASRGCALADLDNDGDLDLVLGEGSDSNSPSQPPIGVVNNIGGRYFGAAPEFYINARSGDSWWNTKPVLCADIDGDGHLDILAGNECIGNIAVLRGDGNGGFGPTEFHGLGDPCGLLAVADVTRDGIPDVVAGGGSPHLLVFEGFPSGVSTAWTDVVVPGFTPWRAPLLADFNGDGHLDAALVENQDDLLILFNDGAGAMHPAPSHQWVDFGWAGPPQAADVDGDGDLDIVTFVNVSGQKVRVHTNAGDGTFTESPLSGGFYSGADFFTLGDVNGDGLPDFIGLHGTRLAVQLNNGDGAFVPELIGLTTTQTTRSKPVCVDLNTDGHRDIAYLTRGSLTSHPTYLNVHLNLGDGSFSAASRLSLGVIGTTFNLVSGDLDGDGDADLVLDGSRCTVLWNDGLAGFTPEQVFPIGASYALAVSIGDADADGDLDLLIAPSSDPNLPGLAPLSDRKLTLLINDGTGAFTPLPTDIASRGTAMFLADLDGNGHADICGLSQIEASSHCRGFTSILNAGDGIFPSPPRITIGSLADPQTIPTSLVVGDINNDGLDDFVTLNSTHHAINVVLADPAGGYHAPVTLTTPPSPTLIRLGDLDGDGYLDAVVAHNDLNDQTSDLISIWMNTGGVLASAGTLPVLTGPEGLAIADMDADGSVDIVVATNQYIGVPAALSVRFFMNTGDGTFDPPIDLPGYDGLTNLIADDIDGDGSIDLAIAVTPNTQGVPFGRVIMMFNEGAPAPSCAGDLNGDGSTNAADFVILAGNFGASVTPNTSGDLNGDGLVNAADFVILAGDLGCVA